MGFVRVKPDAPVDLIDDSDHLNENQQKALDALVRGALQKEAAEEAGVTPTSVSVWMRNPTFKRMYREAVADKLELSLGKTVETLVDLLDSDSEIVRLKAANLMFNICQREAATESKMEIHFNIPDLGIPVRKELEAEGDVE